MKVSREKRFKLLQLFGDGKEHNWYQTIFLGVQYLKVHQYVFEKMLKYLLENSLIVRIENDDVRKSRLENSYVITEKEFSYQITPKGDECLRFEQIKRDGDYDYYKNFDRSVAGSHGVEHYAPVTRRKTNG